VERKTIEWIDVIDKELKEMAKRGVWEVIDEKEIPIIVDSLKINGYLGSKEMTLSVQDLRHVTTVKSQ
jgi:hypothetical protein